MQWLDSLSREEWQARLDAADQVFGRTEASTTKPVVSVRRTKSPKAPKKILHKVG